MKFRNFCWYQGSIQSKNVQRQNFYRSICYREKTCFRYNVYTMLGTMCNYWFFRTRFSYYVLSFSQIQLKVLCCSTGIESSNFVSLSRLFPSLFSFKIVTSHPPACKWGLRKICQYFGSFLAHAHIYKKNIRDIPG